MSLLSPLLVKLYIFNVFKLPLDADPFPALDGFCCCLPLNSLQFLHIILVTRCLGLTAPVQVHSVFGGSCFWVELKREAAESLKGNLLRGLLSESIISRWYFETGFRYGNESVCLAQKLFSTFKWERDGKGEERLSSSKALSTLGFFLRISHCCLHGCSSIHSGTDDSSGTGREANMFRYTLSPQSLQALTPPMVLQQRELTRKKVSCK